MSVQSSGFAISSELDAKGTETVAKIYFASFAHSSRL